MSVKIEPMNPMIAADSRMNVILHASAALYPIASLTRLAST
jgi:hypothetical protein